jgi:hypothetical protein
MILEVRRCLIIEWDSQAILRCMGRFGHRLLHGQTTPGIINPDTVDQKRSRRHLPAQIRSDDTLRGNELRPLQPPTPSRPHRISRYCAWHRRSRRRKHPLGSARAHRTPGSRCRTQCYRHSTGVRRGILSMPWSLLMLFAVHLGVHVPG